MQVTLVPKEHINDIWPRIKKYAEKCAKYTYGRYTAEDMRKQAISDKAIQLWVPFDKDDVYGFYVTEIVDYPQMRALAMHFIGGTRFKEWQFVGWPILQKFARDNNCKVIESYGRPGWKKMWQGYGYETQFIFYKLPVE